MSTFDPAQALTAARDRVGECPVWSAEEQALYWVDIEAQLIHRLCWVTRQQTTWELPQRVGSIAWVGKAVLIAAMETCIARVELGVAPAACVTPVANASHEALGMRFNDGRCDAMGRFWVSSMVMDMSLASPAGALYRLDEQGLSAPLVRGLITPNGLAFSPDSRTLYLSDSHPSMRCIWAFDFDLQAASVSNQRVFVNLQGLAGRPDGAAVDAGGCYWSCANDAGLVHCFSPEGRHLHSLPLPVPKPSMCAFGGPDLDRLLITSIQMQGRAGQGGSGAVFEVGIGRRGLPEPVFRRFPHAGV